MSYSFDPSTLPPPPPLAAPPSAGPIASQGEIASIRRRLGGLALDLVIAFILYRVVFAAFTAFDGLVAAVAGSHSNGSGINPNPGWTIISVLVAVIFNGPLLLMAYFAVSTHVGGSLGNRALGMRVVSATDGDTLRWGLSIGRGAALGALLLGCVAAIAAIFGAIVVALVASASGTGGGSATYYLTGAAVGTVVLIYIILAALVTAGRHPRHQAWHDRASSAVVIRHNRYSPGMPPYGMPPVAATPPRDNPSDYA